jgi:hypothetical protein
MKGVKTMSVANGTAKRFHSDEIIAVKIKLPGDIEVGETLNKLIEDNKKLLESYKELELKIKELNDKYDALETE